MTITVDCLLQPLSPPTTCDTRCYSHHGLVHGCCDSLRLQPPFFNELYSLLLTSLFESRLLRQPPPETAYDKLASSFYSCLLQQPPPPRDRITYELPPSMFESGTVHKFKYIGLFLWASRFSSTRLPQPDLLYSTRFSTGLLYPCLNELPSQHGLMACKLE